MASTESRPAALPSDGIDLINENDAWRVLFRTNEEIANTTGAHADEHFDEFRSRNREKRHTGFSRNRAREERLSRSGRPDKKNTFGNLCSPFDLFFFILYKIKHFNQI